MQPFCEHTWHKDKREMYVQDLWQNYFCAPQHRNKLWSWGTRNPSNIADKSLKFRVSGHRHKGYVYVSCNGMDLMDFALVTVRGNLKQVETDIFIGDLMDRIDKAIEYIPEYANN